MSQFFVNSTGTANPNIETLTGNSGGAVGPNASFNINLLGSNGISVVGDPGTNTLTFSVQNGQTDTGQTIGAVTENIQTIDCSTAGTYFIESRLAAYDPAGNNAGGFGLFTTIVSDGVTATVVDDTDSINHISPAIDGSTLDYEFVAVGSDAVFQVTGVAGFTINWAVFSVYVYIGA